MLPITDPRNFVLLVVIIISSILLLKGLQMIYHTGIKCRWSRPRKKTWRMDDDDDGSTNLPIEMWGEIGQHLGRQQDVDRFKAVCMRWRSSLPPQTRFPLQVPILPDTSIVNGAYILTQVSICAVDDVYCYGKPRKVLMEFDDLDKDTCFVPNALIPHDTSASFYSKVWAMPPCFLANSYRLSITNRWGCATIHNRVSKTVIISSNPNQACYHELSVVARFVKGGKLALLRLNESQDPQWGWITGFCTHFIADISTFKGQLFAVDTMGRAFVMDYDSLEMRIVAEPPLYCGLSIKGVELFSAAPGELYLLAFFINWGTNAKVYKMMSHNWVEVHTMGNRVFLRGMGYNVCIPRDVFTHGNYMSWMMNFNKSTCEGYALILPYMDTGVRFITFCVTRYIHIPWYWR